MPLDIDPDDDSPFPPPGLKEISSLASWTVSTAKPGNGVAALRAPDLALFWQSDGPQPHLLSIHFFKRVALAHMRVYLDYARDESYTPTRMQFLAGTGVHDVLPFAEMSFEHPTGWVDVDFSNVGPVLEDDEDEDEDDAGQREIDWSRRPVLRAFLIQVRILENHQNGKDTHLRAVQLFARDATREGRGAAVTTDEITRKVKAIALPTTAATTRRAAVPREQNNLKMASWMMDPEMR
jgi:anaphase-promoting complex subunit 10